MCIGKEGMCGPIKNATKHVNVTGSAMVIYRDQIKPNLSSNYAH